MLFGGCRSCFCVRFMRDEVGANVQEQKPIRNPYRHQKTSKNSYRQVALRYSKENLLSVGAQSVKPTRRNRSQQEKTPFEELVRMRSPVRIWVAAPKIPENCGFRGFFVAKSYFAGWPKISDPHRDPHAEMKQRNQWTQEHRTGRQASCPAHFSFCPYRTCSIKLPIAAAASSCFWRVAWV